MSLTLKEVPFDEIRIGQVVKFPTGLYAFICQITACVPWHDDPKWQARRWFSFPRYSTFKCYSETGKVHQDAFWICASDVIIDRIIKPEEFYSFGQIVAEESESWEEEKNLNTFRYHVHVRQAMGL